MRERAQISNRTFANHSLLGKYTIGEKKEDGKKRINKQPPNMTKEEIASLEEALLDVQRTILNNRKKAESRLVKVMPNHQQGALNLIDYMSMRSIDFRTIQGRLSSLGLSSFSHSERYVWNNLTNILNLLALLGGKQSDSFPMDAQNDFGRTLSVLGEHTNHLFGEGNPLFKQRIMVTLPTESHANY